jgi:S1-C subfamily serine protease
VQNKERNTPMVLHSADISAGNSGGPLIDSCGRVVGINTLIVTNQQATGTSQTRQIASRVNSLTFVVDTNALYVASSADSLPVAVKAAIDSMFARVAAHNEIRETATQLVEGRLRVPGGDSTAPVYIVDGVRVKRVDSLRVNAIDSIQLVKPADAALAYGSDAAKSGAVVVKMEHRGPKNEAIDESIRQRLAKMGIAAERVDLGNMQWIVTNAGVFGPNPTYLNVLYLKRGVP